MKKQIEVINKESFLLESGQDIVTVEYLCHGIDQIQKLDLTYTEALTLFQASGKYTFERFTFDLDDNYFVVEYRGDVDQEVKVRIEDRINSLLLGDWEFIIAEALKDPENYKPYAEISGDILEEWFHSLI